MFVLFQFFSLALTGDEKNASHSCEFKQI